MLKHNQRKLAVFTFGAISVCLICGGLALAQTKQLKAPANPQIPTDDSNQSQVVVNPPNGTSSSYSVIVENNTTPDGKVTQSRKVWQNGQLVEEEEKTLDADEAQNGFSATIQLPNGQVAPGGLFSSEDEDDVFGSAPANPFEAIRQMEEQMRAQQERMRAQFDLLRQQLGDPNAMYQGIPQQQFNAPNALNFGQAPSKYWIGATIESVPEFLTAQLPIDEKQGVWVQYVAPESPAAKAGIKRYDVIYKIGDEIVANPMEVTKLIDKIGADKVAIEYYRKGKLEKGELTIEERPAQAQKGFVFGAPQQNKNFRVVRPGLIVPESEAQPEVIEAAPSNQGSEADGAIDMPTDVAPATVEAETAAPEN